MKSFKDYIKEYFGKDIPVDKLTDEQYEAVSSAYAEECAEDPDNYGEE